MRISQDHSSWRARGILRRDFRHTHDEPEVTKYKVKKRKKKAQEPRTKPTCKHVWVEVEYEEYKHYDRRHFIWIPHY